MNLHHPLTYLKGVSANRASLLASELGLNRLHDLLHFFPFRYIDKTRFYKIAELMNNNAEVQIIGRIISMNQVKQNRGSRLVAKFQDKTGILELVWFKGHQWIKDAIQTNTPYVIYGKLNHYNGRFSMVHPEMERLEDYKNKFQSKLQPVYSSTEKLSSKGISNKVFRGYIKNLLEEIIHQVEDNLPEYFKKEYQLLDKQQSLLNIHFPKSAELLAKAQYRLKFEELFFIQMQLLRKKLVRKRKIKGYLFPNVGDNFNRFYKEHLPFELTDAQKKVLREIRKDLRSHAHMNRLLQGDVGSGKTIVALLSMLLAIDNGFQATIMAPTEILATQHFNALKSLLQNMNGSVALLTGSTKARERRQIHEELQKGTLKILIGTHALLEDKVQYQNLGLAIIDEQHRFGVAQRSKMWQKGRPSFTLPKGKKIESILQKYKIANPLRYELLKEFQKHHEQEKLEAKQILWERLQTDNAGVEFRRQYVMDSFVVDFVALSKKLVIELETSYSMHPDQKEVVELRTDILEDFGFKVISFRVEEVIFDTEKVVRKIQSDLEPLPLTKVENAIPPHILVMTATPIPRTLAMSVYGDLDISVIDELPPGRKEVKTVHRYDSNRLSVFNFMKKEIAKGRQVYVVYPLIQESEAMDYKDLMDGYESIVREFPPNGSGPTYQISIVHGKMKAEDKEFEMQRFAKGETQIMVATTVIEVGVNVPNASVMVIESAERFGLSQLHQLRGRVGRGADQSFCILLSSYKLSSEAKTRLQTMVETSDGFKIAEVDLKLRGPGNIMGTQQSGVLSLKIADVVKDTNILQKARNAAIKLLHFDENLSNPKNKKIQKVLLELSKNSGIWSNIS